MYGALGAAQCLTQQQSFEASRLCNCKLYGHPGGTVKGFGAPYDVSSVYIDIDTSGGGGGCEPASIPMPADFDPNDPCEAVSRGMCPPRLTRPGTSTSTTRPPPVEQEEDFETTEAEGAARRQTILVYGILGAVLVGAGLLVYREVRSS
jgi:hypothetical protein